MNSGKAQKKSLTDLVQANINLLISAFIGIFIAIFSFLIYDLYKSADELSVAFIKESEIEIQEAVQSYINDINHLISNNSSIQYQNAKDILNLQKNNRYYTPSLTYFESINSIVIASTNGDSYMLHRSNDEWMNRITKINGDTTEEDLQYWKEISTDDNEIFLLSDTSFYDPRVRPWYLGATKELPNTIYWTAPYQLHTDMKYGITASLYNFASNGDTIITAYNILLTNFNQVTNSIKLTPNSYAFIVTASDLSLVGLSNKKQFNDVNSTNRYLLSKVTQLNLPPLKEGIEYWCKNNKNQSSL